MRVGVGVGVAIAITMWSVADRSPLYSIRQNNIVDELVLRLCNIYRELEAVAPLNFHWLS